MARDQTFNLPVVERQSHPDPNRVPYSVKQQQAGPRVDALTGPGALRARTTAALCTEPTNRTRTSQHLRRIHPHAVLLLALWLPPELYASISSAFAPVLCTLLYAPVQHKMTVPETHPNRQGICSELVVE